MTWPRNSRPGGAGRVAPAWRSAARGRRACGAASRGSPRARPPGPGTRALLEPLRTWISSQLRPNREGVLECLRRRANRQAPGADRTWIKTSPGGAGANGCAASWTSEATSAWSVPDQSEPKEASAATPESARIVGGAKAAVEPVRVGQLASESLPPRVRAGSKRRAPCAERLERAQNEERGRAKGLDVARACGQRISSRRPTHFIAWTGGSLAPKWKLADQESCGELPRSATARLC